MKLLVHVQQPPSGPYRSVELDYSNETTGLDCHQELCALWGGSSFNWSIKGQDIRQLVPGRAPWTDGALLAASSSSIPSLSEENRLFTLRVVHGPASQAEFSIARGNWPLGRQAPFLRIDDPALASVEGTLEVASSGIFFSNEKSRYELKLGQKFTVGDSVLVLDSRDYTPLPFCDSVLEEIEVSAPRSKVVLISMIVLPLVLGLVIAWLTQLWLVFLMACGSSVLMGVHAFAQGRDRSTTRRQINQLAHAEAEILATYRGVKWVKEGEGFILGRGSRPVRVTGRQRQLSDIPEVQSAPYLVTTEKLSHLLPSLPPATQRLVLFQVLKTGQPLYLLLPDKSHSWAIRTIEPLLVSPQVKRVTLDEIDSLPQGYLMCATVPSSLPHQLHVLPLLAETRDRRTAGFTPDSTWHDFVLDGISEEQYCSLLSERHLSAQQTVKKLSQSVIVTSQFSAYSFHTPSASFCDKTLWASEVSMFLGKSYITDSEIELSLREHGPHFLCAGTTGSGKSQLLRSLLWSLALSYPPQRVAFILIDFKGGAGLGPLAPLPHLISFISDLDTSQLVRTMKFLRADITKRKQTWKELGVSSYEDYVELCKDRHQVPDFPELVICIDEFRMLVDDYPDIMDEMMKIATIGRSLGYHLILATQRPQGAISPDIRANISTALCLRVSSAQESFNVLGSEAAASIPASTPGRGLVRTTHHELIEFQVPLITGLQEHLPEDTCQARFLLNLQESAQESQYRALKDRELEATNVSIFRAYEDLQQLSQYRPIPEPLQGPLIADLLDAHQSFSLLLGQYEVPELGYQSHLTWSAGDGPVLVQGSAQDYLPALQTTLIQALERGFSVLCFTTSEQHAQHIRRWGAGYDEALEVFTYQDFDYVQYLLNCCIKNPCPGQLLVIDGVETLLEALHRYPVAEAQLQQLLSPNEQPGLQVFCTSVTGVRGKYQQIFEHILLSPSALENDPLRSHAKKYPLPSSQQFSLEGRAIYELAEGRIQAGTLAWAKIDRVDRPASDAETGQKMPSSAGSICKSTLWRPLPLRCQVSSLRQTEKPHPGALALGVLQDGSTAYTPRLRGGFMSISGPRNSGKTCLLQAIVQANPDQLFIYISGSDTSRFDDIEGALRSSQSFSMRPVLLIDDVDRLNNDIQHAILTQKDRFSAVIVTYAPWPRWNTAPILAALNGTSTGIVLTPHSSADLSFYPGAALPLNLRTHGQVPAGRGVILDYANVLAFQGALPEPFSRQTVSGAEELKEQRARE